MIAKELKRLIALIPDDAEVVLDNFYGNGEFDIFPKIEERAIPYLDSDCKSAESWKPWNVAYVITTDDVEGEE
jgi:hypothetical protein